MLRPITRAISRAVTASVTGWHGASAFDPLSLFANGEHGFLWSSLPYHQDPAGTTEATWGDPVGLIGDDSGNGADFTQPTVTARPILRNDPPRLEFDLVDDLLQTTLPAITNGTLVLAGTNGIWIDDDFNHAGGAFTVGPTTYTGGPVGILPIVGDLIVGGSFVIDRQLTAEERARVVNRLKSMGAPGVFELGPELVVNGDFSDGLDGWQVTSSAPASVTWESGSAVLSRAGASGASASIAQSSLAVDSGSRVLVSVRVVSNSGQPAYIAESITGSGQRNTPSGQTGSFGAVRSVGANNPNISYSVAGDASGIIAIGDVSVRKLELIP